MRTIDRIEHGLAIAIICLLFGGWGVAVASLLF